RPQGEADLVTMVAALSQHDGDGALGRPVYDAPHVPRPWGWKVSAYLWTKAIGAGALLVAALTGSSWWGTTLTITAPAISLLFVALFVHGALLVIELVSRHPVRDAALAARLLSRGAYRIHFWGGVLLLGTLVPMLALVAAAAIDATAPSVLAAVLALAGLWLW